MKDFLKRNEYPIMILGFVLSAMLWMYIVGKYTVSPLRESHNITAAFHTMNAISEETAKMNIMYNNYYSTIKDFISTNNATTIYLSGLNKECWSELRGLVHVIDTLNIRVINLESNLSCMQEMNSKH